MNTATPSSSSSPPIPCPFECPYGVDDIPNKKWKVEHYLVWVMLKNEHQYRQNLSEQRNALHETLAQLIGSRPPSNYQNHISDSVNHNDNSSNSAPLDSAATQTTNKSRTNTNKINKIPLGTASNSIVVASSAKKATAPSAKKATSGGNSIHRGNQMNSSSELKLVVEIVLCAMDPSLNGKRFNLEPKLRSPCWLGRSRAAKLRQRGISVPLDSEMSNNHGKFEMQVDNTTDGQQVCYYYTDADSSNGSYLLVPIKEDGGDNGDNPKTDQTAGPTTFDSQVLQPHEPLLLKNGMELLMGQTRLKIYLQPSL